MLHIKWLRWLKIQPMWSITFVCGSGGSGWGETGNEVRFVFPFLMTRKKMLRYAPGGYVIKSQKLTFKNIYGW